MLQIDQSNLNMWQHRYLDVMNDYHPGKVNVMADALIRKAVTAPIRDIMMMTMITPLLKQIREAQVGAMKEEHRKSERIVGQVASFDYDSQGLLNLHQRVWVSYWVGV